MNKDDLVDTLMRLAIVGLIVDRDDIQKFENSLVDPPAVPGIECLHLRVRDPRSNQTTSYVRTRIVGTSHEKSEASTEAPHVALPSIVPSASSNPEIDIESISSFIPVHFFSQFPKEYIYDEGQENYVTQHWFKQFWDRSWDLFLLPVPQTRAILVVPEVQAQALLTEINTTISENLTLDEMNKDGLILRFEKVGGPKPIYFGRSKSYAEKETINGNISSFNDYPGWEKYTEGLTAAERTALEETLMNAILPAEKNGVASCKRARRAEKKALHRKEIQLQLTRTLELLQLWLGLRRRSVTSLCQNQEQTNRLPPVNVLAAPDCPFQDDVLFIGIDCEWMERSPNNLTEVGISILDTRDLANLPPGDYGDNWKKRIRSYHFRVSEYQHHVNNEFCKGCPDKFEWGESAIIDQDDMGKAIDSCLGSHRNMILIGLDMKRDVELIARTGSDRFTRLRQAAELGAHCRVDVADLFQILRGRSDKLGMVRLLNELNETHTEYLHNAGNDARYTMHILIRIALESAGEKPGLESMKEMTTAGPS
ncbi:hypothetical protein N7456_008615 [Penicillium angulare]|uniref:Gfd2/YDR514C-like C-terminal domain-containing protein n=1 Tax=Penicillium angulare TaxID=116970 RepID=A0A9W9F369_9EURO|nr:hypothetical protein N7456_008615 [Penicillium angulare]